MIKKGILIPVKSIIMEKLLSNEIKAPIVDAVPDSLNITFWGYCTKEDPLIWDNGHSFQEDAGDGQYSQGTNYDIYNGKVACKFNIIKIEELQHAQWTNQATETYWTKDLENSHLLADTGMAIEEICKYGKGRPLYILYITNLDVLWQPLDLEDFVLFSAFQAEKLRLSDFGVGDRYTYGHMKHNKIGLINKEPETWQYVLKGEK